MLVFLDESFRDSKTRPDTTLGALCGVAIPERELARVTKDVYQLKLKHLGVEFAKNDEIKGKDLLKAWVFRLAAKGERSRNLSLATDLVAYLAAKRIAVLGCVCFDKGVQQFKCQDVAALDVTFRYLFERIDTYMKIHHPDRMAKLVFDDRDYSINSQNAEAITNFFVRSAAGLSLDSIVKTPFFAISQAQNVGLQLADFVTTVIGMRFAGNLDIRSYFAELKKSIPSYASAEGVEVSCLKVIRGEKRKAPGGLTARGRDKKAQRSALPEYRDEFD